MAVIQLNKKPNTENPEVNRPRALIAMSGGVDSSASAYLTRAAGYDCVGVTMRLFDYDMACEVRPDKACCTDEDVRDAILVCLKMDIPHHMVDFKAAFKDTVIDPFIADYENGRTPNPCINCNRYLKFEELFRQADDFGCDIIVTGHYARVVYNEDTGRWNLKKASFLEKDQSYVLYNLTQEQLKRIRFPLGDMTKTDARAVAEEAGFKNAQKHESQDICFVPTGKYVDFIHKTTEKTYPEGDFVDVRTGEVLGTHKGIIRYTVGQRKGLGLSLKQPMYVTKVDPEENKVYLGLNEDLFTTTLEAEDMNWISVPGFTSLEDEPLRVTAKVRYKQPDSPATVYPLPEGRVKVVFDEPQRAITKGQAVVLYSGEDVVGGGTIC